MTATRADVEQLFEQVEALAYVDRVPAAEAAARAADEVGEDDLRFRSRLLLVQAYNYTTDRQRMIVPFGFLLQHYDAAPGWLTDWDRYNVLWHYKWMVTQLMAHPQVALAQLEDALAGMRRRYTEAGEGLAPVLGCAYRLAAHRHGAAAAQAEYDAWVHAPRTELSDCEGCEPSVRIRHLAALGRHEDAVAELGPVVRGEVGCFEQPQWAASEALASLVEVGRVAEAADLHLRTSRVSRRNPDETGRVAKHLLLLARTGNLGRGLELLAEQLPALEQAPTPLDGLVLAAAAERLLAAVVEEGLGDLPVRPRGGEQTTAAGLLPSVRERAADLAARFDERNGTTAVSDAVRGWTQAPPLAPMPLGAVARAHDAAGPSPTSGFAAPAPLDLPTVPTHPEVPPLDDLDALDVRALHRASELVKRFAHLPSWAAVAAGWEARRAEQVALAGRPDADPALGWAVADLEYFSLWQSREPDAERAASAARLFRLAGDEAEALLVEELQAVRSGEGTDPEAFVAAVRAHGTPEQLARALSRVASELLGDAADRHRTEGLALLQDVDLRADPDARSTKAHLLLARLAADDARPDDEPVLDDVLALLQPEEYPEVRVRVQINRAWHQLRHGEHAAALAELDGAVETSRRAGAPELALRALGMRAQVLADTGEREAAEQLLGQVVAALDGREDTDDAREARAWLAELLAAQGRLLEAVEVVETALAVRPDRPDQPDLSRSHGRYRAAVRARLLDLGSRLSVDLGERDRALALAREAVEVTTGEHGRPVHAGAALFQLAEILSGEDPVGSTTAYRQALEQATAADDHRLALVVRRERVWARLAADGLDAALADVDDAEAANTRVEELALTDRSVRESVAGWNFEWEPLALSTLRGRVLAEAGEPQRALDAIEGLPGRMRAVGDAEPPALDVEVLRGRLLLDIDREDDGLGLLEQVAVRARTIGHQGLRRAAASAGARWLDAHDRPEQAQAFWDRLTEDEDDGAEGRDRPEEA